MNTAMTRKLLTAGLLSLCAAGLTVQAQTASPGPPSRNANVDKEDPNKPDTPEHEIPSQEAPGSGNNNDRGAAGETTPTGGDGSPTMDNRDPTQPIPRNSAEQNASTTSQDCGELKGAEKAACEQERDTQSGSSSADSTSSESSEQNQGPSGETQSTGGQQDNAKDEQTDAEQKQNRQ